MKYSVRDFILLLLVICFIASGVFWMQQKTPSIVSKATFEENEGTNAPKIPVNSSQTVHSPDGSLQVTLKSVELSGTQSAYVLNTSDIHGENRHSIYKDTLSSDSTMQVPANSWSPDNKFIFISGNTPEGLKVLVFRATGEPFADGQQFIDLSKLFQEKLPNAVLRGVTGWDDPALLHVFTYNADKTIGYSYWFDIWSKSFIQLANR